MVNYFQFKDLVFLIITAVLLILWIYVIKKKLIYVIKE